MKSSEYELINVDIGNEQLLMQNKI